MSAKYGHAEVHPRPGARLRPWKVLYFQPKGNLIKVTYHRSRAKALKKANEFSQLPYQIVEA